MSRLIDMAGMRFEKLLVIERINKDEHGQAKWLCKCDCGNKTVVLGSNLRRGKTKSCGCWRQENGVNHAVSMTKHGQHNTRLYRIWNTMKNRCQNPNVHNYFRYGGRGITVCKEWQEFTPFYEWSTRNGYRENLTLDRIDNFKGYSPENCRWVTMKEQHRNRMVHQLKRMEEGKCQ